MKKVASFVLGAALLLFAALPATAADFTPSVQGKQAPEIVVVQQDGRQIAGQIIDAQGNLVAQVEAGAILVTPVAQADEALKQAYEQLKATPLEQLIPQLTAFLSDLPQDISVQQLVVRDLFDVSVDAQTRQLLDAGNSIRLSFQLGVSPQELVLCLHNHSDSQWEVIDHQKVKNNGDGTVTVEFSNLSPVAFAVQKGGALEDAPPNTTQPQQDEELGQTTGQQTVLILGVVAVAAAVAAAIALAGRKR